MKAKKAIINTASNLLSRAWTMVANFVFVPLYIRALGEETYGLITFFVTLQATLNLLGLGLSKTLRREFAANEQRQTALHKYQIMRSAELIYWVIGFGIVLICALGANVIVENWLRIDRLAPSLISLTIKLMGVSIAAQLIANLYLGCLFGMEKQVLANCVQIGWSLIKNVGSVLILLCFLADIRVYYLWHIIWDVAYFLLLRFFVISDLRKKEKDLFWKLRDISNMKSIWKFAAGIMATSVGYTLNSQFDKTLISGMFSLTIVGAYNSTYNLGYVAAVVVSALGNAMFPRFTAYYTTGRIDEQNKLFVKTNRFANCITCSMGAFIAVFSHTILLIWTQSDTIADAMKDAAFWLIMGSTLSALQEIPYNYLLSRGVTIVNAIQTACAIMYVLIVTPLMIAYQGLMGAAMAWFLEMLLSTSIYLTYIFLKYFKSSFFQRMVVDTFLALLSSIVFAKTIAWLIKQACIINPYAVLGLAIMGGILCFLTIWCGTEYISGRLDNGLFIERDYSNKR